MKTICAGLVIASCLILPVASQTSQAPPAPAKPTKTPVAPTPDQLTRIRAGIRLYDQGKFDESIAIYEEVLKDNPDCVAALYEMSNSFEGKKDYVKALEYATLGTQYDSPDLASFYMLVATAHDNMGESAKAIDTYKLGIAIKPTFLLYFNLGIAFERQNNDVDATASFKQAALLNPNHASSQLELGKLFLRHGYRSQGLLAISRFLVLEPGTARTAEAYNAWLNTLFRSATKGADAKVNVSIAPPADKAEGDFQQPDILIGIGRSAALVQSEGRTQAQQLVQQLDGWFATLKPTADDKVDQSAFTWTYYVPYFVELQKRGYTEPFVYWVSQRTNLEGVREWISVDANRQRGNAFIQWSQQYVWPKPQP